MIATVTRRRFLAISAAATAVASRGRADRQMMRWRGSAFGADASILLAGLDGSAARSLFAAVEAEVDRLEALFSLHRHDSQISRLNQAGRLSGADPAMAEVLRLAGHVHVATGGAFDPTVQPLWTLHASAARLGQAPAAGVIAEALSRSGWTKLAVSEDRIAFAESGMAITLNGIAQGYAADRIRDLLRSRGMTNVLIDMGEIAALGRHPDGEFWRVGVAAPDGTAVREIPISDRALATSAPLGTLLDPAGRVGHIIDPRTGQPGGLWRLVSVSASSAALADALSTGFCLMPRKAIDVVLSDHPDARLEALI